MPQDKAWKEDPLGPPDSEGHAEFVADVVRVVDSYTRQAQQTWTKITGYYNLYFGEWTDPRDPVTERWRSHVTLPYPFSGVEAKLASLSDIFTSADPMIQAEGVGDEDYLDSRGVERLIDYTMRATQFAKFLVGRQRDCLIQGTSFYKLVWKDEYSTRYVMTTDKAREDFMSAIDSLEKDRPDLVAAMPDFAERPEEFEAWRQMIKGSLKVSLPEAPLSSVKRIVRYRGPKFIPIRAWDVLLDPLIEEIQDQPWIIHRILKPKSWVEERAGSEPDKPFDKKAVEYAIKGWSGEKLTEYEQAIAQARGLSVNDMDLPGSEDLVELLEVWNQTEPQSEVPYAVILGRNAVINKDKQAPYQHGACTIGAIRNVMVPGHFFGISDLAPSKALYEEANTHRSLRLDSVKLSTLPVFTRLNGQGVPELYNHLRPGGIMPVARHDLFKRLDLGNTPAESYREMSEIKNDIDETNATGQNVRGGVATVGRVSATETQGRVTQALLRVKMVATLMSEDLHPYVKQMVSLWHERGDVEAMKNITGTSGITVTPGMLYEALGMDFRFRGPTRSLNREMQAQQISGYVKQFETWMTPEEMRAAMKLFLEAVGVRGVSKLITDGGTTKLKAMWEAKMNAANQQGQIQGIQSDAAKTALTEPSGGTTVPPAEAPPQ